MFVLEMVSPIPYNFIGGVGAPGLGGHAASNEWYEKFGNDLAAPVGTPVVAMTEGIVTKIDLTHAKLGDDGKYHGKKYGVGLGIQSTANGLIRDAPGGVSFWYAHIALRDGLTEDDWVPQGSELGSIVASADVESAHLHIAIAERVQGERRMCDIYQTLKEFSGSMDPFSVRFFQDGRMAEVV
jgi:murein DD-endopeptidase MepM/ murein hydrolase activator NlpD